LFFIEAIGLDCTTPYPLVNAAFERPTELDNRTRPLGHFIDLRVNHKEIALLVVCHLAAMKKAFKHEKAMQACQSPRLRRLSLLWRKVLIPQLYPIFVWPIFICGGVLSLTVRGFALSHWAKIRRPP